MCLLKGTGVDDSSYEEGDPLRVPAVRGRNPSPALSGVGSGGVWGSGVIAKGNGEGETLGERSWKDISSVDLSTVD